MPRRYIEMGGWRFGRLVALTVSDKRSRGWRARFWHCRCDCGREVVVSGYRLRAGESESCGCAREEARERQRAEDQQHAAPLAREIREHARPRRVAELLRIRRKAALPFEILKREIRDRRERARAAA